MSEHGPAQRPAEPEWVPLQGDDARARRRKGVSGLVGVALFAAAAGGIAGLIGGMVAGLVAAGIVAVPLLYVVLYNARRMLWIGGNELMVRTWRTHTLDLSTAGRIDLMVTDVRGTRTVSLLINSAQRRASVKVDVAAYSGAGGRELGVLALRRFADALANNIEANGMVFSELLVAQLRSEARGDGAADRPLYRMASAAPSGKFAQRFPMEAVSRFVAGLQN